MEVMNELDNKIIKILEKSQLNNKIDVCTRSGIEQIGYGCFVSKIFNNLLILTQGDATFFFLTSKKEYRLKMTLQSFVGLSVTVSIENVELGEFDLHSLSERELFVIIRPDQITKNISKIIISTNKLWSLKYLDKDQYDIHIGIGIRNIELISSS
jgi:hypothetical protein